MKQEVHLHSRPIFKVVEMIKPCITCGFELLLPNPDNDAIQLIFNFGFGFNILYIGFKICWDDKCKLSHEI